MNFQWMSQTGRCPIVEFHDVRTETFGADRYLGAGRAPLRGAAARRRRRDAWASSGCAASPTG